MFKKLVLRGGIKITEVLEQGAIFSGSKELAEVFAAAGCEALDLAAKPEDFDVPEEQAFDLMPPIVEFHCGSTYLIMAIPPAGSSRNKEIERWGDDTSKVPVSFITVANSDTRIKSVAGQDLPADPNSVVPNCHIQVMTITFIGEGVVVSPSSSIEEGFFVAYGDVIDIMRTVRIMTSAEFHEMRHSEFIGEVIANPGKIFG